MIDWFTVIAQIVNFLILVVLLKYFLYGRILAAMEQREQEIAGRWDEAQRQREEAAAELEAARQKNRSLQEQREQLFAQVREEVEQHRQQLAAKIRTESEELRSRWADAIQEETDSFLRDLRRRVSEEVFSIARKALSDLAGADLERQMVERFVHKIEGLEQRQRAEMMSAAEAGNRIAVVQTTYGLPKNLQHEIAEMLRRQFFDDLDVQFELAPEALCGIALQTETHKLAWDLSDYLASLEQQLQQTLEEEATARRPRAHEMADAER